MYPVLPTVSRKVFKLVQKLTYFLQLNKLKIDPSSFVDIVGGNTQLLLMATNALGICIHKWCGWCGKENIKATRM